MALLVYDLGTPRPHHFNWFVPIATTEWEVCAIFLASYLQFMISSTHKACIGTVATTILGLHGNESTWNFVCHITSP